MKQFIIAGLVLLFTFLSPGCKTEKETPPKGAMELVVERYSNILETAKDLSEVPRSIDEKSAVRSYNAMFLAYLRTFARMGLKAIPMAADTGPIGGDLSHEFLVIAETGESEVFYPGHG